MIKHILCAAVILSAPVAGYPRGEKVLLQYRQRVGEILDYRSELNGTVTIEQLAGWVRGERGKPRSITVKKELSSSAEVVDRSDGEMNMVFRFGKGFNERTEGKRSKKKEIDLGGKDIKIAMWQNGRAEVEDRDALEAVFRKTGAPSMEEPLFLTFPKKPLKVGATWKQKVTRHGLLIQGESIRYVVRYKLARIEEYRGMRCAVIEGRGSFKLKDYKGQTRRGKKVDIIKAKEEIESVVYFAIDRGIPVESRKKVKRNEIREWEAKGDKEPYRDELTTEIEMKLSLFGGGEE